jgi:hypothetical protein
MPLTSIGVDAPYTFIVSNSPIDSDGVITLAYNPAQPLLPANGGTGLTTIGTAGQFLVSNGTSLVWTTVQVGGVTNVTASGLLSSSGGTTPNITINSTTGSGGVVLDTSPTLTTPTITGDLTLNGPLIGTVPTSTATAGTYAGIDTLGNASVTLVSNTTAQYIDMARTGVDYDCRLIYNNVGFDRLTIFTGGGHGAAYFSQTAAGIIATNIILSGAVSFSGSLGPNQVVVTDGANNLSTTSTTGSGALVRDNGASMFNTRFYGNTFQSINYAWYAGAGLGSFPNNSNTVYRPAAPPFDSQGTLLGYDSATGIFTNNTGATIFVTANYHLNRNVNAFGSSTYWIELGGGAERMARTMVAAVDWSSAGCQFKLGIGNTFRVFGYQDSGSNLLFNDGAGFQYSYTFYE